MATMEQKTASVHTGAKAKVFKNFIGGEWVESRTGRTFENLNPADTREVVGIFQKSGKEDVDHAIETAKEAFKKWRLVPAPRRAEMLYKASELLIARKEDYAQDMTREMGKVIKETRGDVQEAIDCGYYTAGEGRRLFGPTVPSELPNKFAMAIRQPLGVCAMITPWNFPMAIPSWKLFPALVAGNTAVIKPAQDTPLSTLNFVKTLHDAGIPAGVVNIVTGFGGEVGTPMTEHPEVRAVSLTGSTAVGRIVGQEAAKTFKHCSLELGGKNPMIVLDDANLELALEGALWGAFGTTGQRCTATSRIIVQKGVYKKFVDELVARAKKLKVGNGLDESVDMGPAVNSSQMETDLKYIKIGKDEGAKMLCGGHRLEGERVEPRLVRCAHGVRRCGSQDAHRAGRDLRPGGFDHCVRWPGERDRDRQRHRVRTVIVDLHQRREQGVHGHARSVRRHHLHQRAHDWRRGASALRRHQGHR